MDYKYIEQLLESYFDCCTTLQEEQILQSFFSQENVPGHLLQYAGLFRYEAAARKDVLDEKFDQRIMALVEEEAPQSAADKTEARPTERRFLRAFPRAVAPFFKAAAVVAIALTIGRATEHAIGEQAAEERDHAVAVDPYIKSGDVMQAIRIKDVSQAETKATNDSLMSVTAVPDAIQ